MKLFFSKAWWVLTHIQMLRDFAARHFYNDGKIDNDDDIQIIRNSIYFDEAYYKRNNPDLLGIEDLFTHYLLQGGFERRDPSEYFCSDEYLSINVDAAKIGINPLYNYLIRNTKDVRLSSTLQTEQEDNFPEGTKTMSATYGQVSAIHKRSAIVSCFFHNGKIPDSLMILLRGLKEVADNLILIGDCPVFPTEMEKLQGIVHHAQFKRHYQYDFGSYKIGLNYARKAGLLKKNTADELIMVNDSCYGPVYPFSELFQRMENELCDFWGISGLKKQYPNGHKPHISSYFYVFRRSVLDKDVIDNFMNAIQGNYDRTKVVLLLETELTDYLQKKGFVWQTVYKGLEHNIYTHPLIFLDTYRIPFIKKKALNGNTDEVQNKIFSIISDNCPELIPCILSDRKPSTDFIPPSIREHQESIPEKIKRVTDKIQRGEKLKTLLLAPYSSSFPVRFLLKKMLSDPIFEPFIAIIPDLSEKNNFIMDVVSEILKQEKEILSMGFPEKTLIRIRPDELGRWPDVSKQMDLVWYSTPKNISSFRYQPKYAAGRDFLPLMLIDNKTDNYNVPDILSLDSCRYMWKIFFTNETTLKKYKKHCVDGGRNGELLVCRKDDKFITKELLRRVKGELNPSGLHISEEK